MSGLSARIGRLALLIALAATPACGPSKSDVARWAEPTEEGGPEKLAAVVKDERAAIDVRRDAALALAHLVRRNRRIGIDLLVDALARSSEAGRALVIDAIAPALARETTQPRPGELLESAPLADDPPDQLETETRSDGDPSLAAKDTVHALLARDLVPPSATKDELRAALLTWVETSTLYRMRDARQRYSVEQAMRLLGAPSVKKLPALFGEPLANPATLASLVAELGDADTKRAAGSALAKTARDINGGEWAKTNRTLVEATNARNKVTANAKQVDAQLATYRDMKLGNAFIGLTTIGGAEAIAELVAQASDPATSDEARELAFLALAPHVRTLDPPAQERIFAVAEAPNVPDPPPIAQGVPSAVRLRRGIRDAAFACIARLEGTPEIDKRLRAMLTRNWRARLGAMTILLGRLARDAMPELLDALARSTKSVPLDVNEPLAYGPLLLEVAGRDALVPYLEHQETTLRLVAISALAAEAELLRRFESDATPLQDCAKGDDDCDRICDQKNVRGATTIGAFVKTCAGTLRTVDGGLSSLPTGLARVKLQLLEATREKKDGRR